jgi:hypothetical protein
MSCEGGLAHPLRAEGPSLIIVASVAFGFNFESPIMAAIKREWLPNRRQSETADFEFAGHTGEPMSDLVERKRLPNRRCHEVVEFTHNGFGYTAGFGRFDDGKLAEVFLNADKVGTAIETQARDAAITASLLFQNGGSPETFRRALTRNADGSGPGALGKLLDILLSEEMP